MLRHATYVFIVSCLRRNVNFFSCYLPSPWVAEFCLYQNDLRAGLVRVWMPGLNRPLVWSIGLLRSESKLVQSSTVLTHALLFPVSQSQTTCLYPSLSCAAAYTSSSSFTCFPGFFWSSSSMALHGVFAICLFQNAGECVYPSQFRFLLLSSYNTGWISD